jgi:hypothetical protein
MKTNLKELQGLALFIDELHYDGAYRLSYIDKNHLGHTVMTYDTRTKSTQHMINGRHTKAELWNLMHAYIKGLTYVKGAK